MGRYRYEEIEERLNRVGGSLRPPAKVRRAKCEDRTKAGRLEYWTAEVQKDLDSAIYWNAAESLLKLSGAREDNGRPWETAMWSGIVMHLQSILLFKAERTCEWMEIFAEDEPDKTPFKKWLELEPFSMDAPAWQNALDHVHNDGKELFGVIPGIETFCLLASPQECIEGLAGGKEVSKRVFQRLTERLRASCSPARGRGRSASPPPCRP